ncbi:MAG TPA: isochorismatase family protein [Candidatus Binatia bacterium]|nr:isochorismatase family protein [Candidatus Binatia bacterium]
MEARRDEPVAYDPRTALVVVDVQNDFADPKGSLYVAGGEEVVPVANREIERARSGGGLVVYTQDWHPPSTPHFAKDGGTWPVHCVRGTWGAELAPGLRRADGLTVRTGAERGDGYSAFGERDPVSGAERSTGLARDLRARGIERLVVLGLATDYCVKDTAIDGAREGFATTVLADGVRAVERTPGDGARALAAMRAAGVKIVGAGRT